MYAQDNISASLDYFVTSSPPYLHQFSTISGGNYIIATPFRDPISRLPFATHFRDSRSRPHSRLAFATTLATRVRDSRSRSQPRLAIFVMTSVVRLHHWTVLTPQRHLPSVPTLTLLKYKNFGTYSLAWPPPLPTTHHHVHPPPPPRGCVSPDTPFGPTPPSRGLYTSCQAPFHHPHLYHTP